MKNQLILSDSTMVLPEPNAGSLGRNPQMRQFAQAANMVLQQIGQAQLSNERFQQEFRESREQDCFDCETECCERKVDREEARRTRLEDLKETRRVREEERREREADREVLLASFSGVSPRRRRTIPAPAPTQIGSSPISNTQTQEAEICCFQAELASISGGSRRVSAPGGLSAVRTTPLRGPFAHMRELRVTRPESTENKGIPSPSKR